MSIIDKILRFRANTKHYTFDRPDNAHYKRSYEIIQLIIASAVLA
jgi:hypothetical protein